MASTEETSVVIIGGGTAGLALATFLGNEGVACVVLERRDRATIQARQRAGAVDASSVRMFERRGLADKLLAGPVTQTIDYRVNGVGRVFTVTSDDGSEGRFCTQQMLVANLMRELIDNMGGDVRFAVSDVRISNEEGERPRVQYDRAGETHSLTCDFIAGCDADHGVSRASIPADVLTTVSHEFGYAWLASLVEAPAAGPAIMGTSDRGFVSQIPRGPERSRYYLQCPVSDGPEDWPDERIWDEIRLRLNDDTIKTAPVLTKEVVPLRSVIHYPMQYRNLFLAGDAAHLVPPTGGKGMNMALYDVDVLADALTNAVKGANTSGIECYSDTVMPRVWRYQEFSAWLTDTMHDGGDPAQHGAFRQMTARARLDELFTSPAAARLHSDYLRGLA
ncbi:MULTISPECIES: 4-hydroxybenzoate 3-monooxygenase [Rhodopseudomonas]|uniref:Hydroxybenzoate 3-monooxygenase n=1 Tax=Rhodopseudomonas palustris TaxID=1076 RepID=A0A0D7F2M5_RHOPL|nr:MULTISPECIES: 4-hydroxybenzoate 3-monooxygenase [Rhodopseudomonas]KIZ47328.1 hydroxybenzoate 3-monooxygenase [Rhodopseudomonas palustris]MDF3812893.1 4-hydroxybenzoate 3-monooxygenase [Rhodopseudomonas sp. BAL398]WOK18996.1 4-hydroxybenzoate 3-monooxygenase [Rhodopseudomonas sp. BAL398]